MPSKSPAQARLMAAVAHGWHKPGGGGPPVKVAKEFNQADKGTGIMAHARGGSVEGSAKDVAEDTRMAKRAGMSMKQWEGSAADRKHDKVPGLAGGGVAPTGVMPMNTGAPAGGAPMARNTPTLPSQAAPRATAALAARPAMPSQAFGGNRPATPMGGAGNVGGNFAMPTQAKTSTPGIASFAKGGPVLGRTTDFMKTPDRFREGSGRYGAAKPEPTEDVFGKGMSKANPEGRDKSEKPVKPRG